MVLTITRSPQLNKIGQAFTYESSLVSTSADLRVDRENRVIRGVKILGFISGNPPRSIGVESDQKTYRYTREAMINAIPLYEGVFVFVDHLSSEFNERGQRVSSGEERKLENKFGILMNVHVTESGMFGDLHYLESHRLSSMIVEAAERMPNLFALSHYAISRPEILPSGEVIISEISHVQSVDIIGEMPGTTRGLFESFQGTPEMKPEELTPTPAVTPEMEGVTPTDVAETPAMSLRDKVLSFINNSELDDAALIAAIAGALDLVPKAAETPEADPADAELTPTEPAKVEESRKLAKGTSVTIEARLAALEQENQATKRENKIAQRLLQCTTYLSTRGIIVTESRVNALATAKTRGALDELLATFGQADVAGKPGGQPGGARSAAPALPNVYSQESAKTHGSPVADTPETIKSLAATVLNG